MKTFRISDKIKEVSRIGIGCMRITGLPDEKTVRELIDGAMELGINFFDHAEYPCSRRGRGCVRKRADANAAGANRRSDKMRDPPRESVMIFQKNIF